MKSDAPKLRPTQALIYAVVAALLATGNMAQSDAGTISDMIIVMEANGTHYTAQHTLYTEDELTVVTLPQNRKQLHVEFGGPNSAVFARAHEQNPDRLSLWSGTVFSRYHDQFETELTEAENQPETSSETINANLAGFELTMANTEKLSYSVTWILPENAELVSLSPDAERAKSVQGTWNQQANLITYRQYGGAPLDVAIKFRLGQAPTLENDLCTGSFTASDECSPDVDQDGVPDYRDVCLPALEADPTTGSPTGASTENPTLSADPLPRQASTQPNGDALGCANETIILLEDIKFANGKTYLSAKVRQVLDRVALAIQRSEGELFEVASHTDNEGRVQHNQRLSDNRADAVRHYLMLRGVGPNQLRARGYGETSPDQDNSQALNRTANRRVELRRIQ